MPRLVLGVAGVLLLVGLAGAGQDNMQTALKELRQARKELEGAADNKGGHKTSAIDHIDKAIAQVQAGIDFAKEKQ